MSRGLACFLPNFGGRRLGESQASTSILSRFLKGNPRSIPDEDWNEKEKLRADAQRETAAMENEDLMSRIQRTMARDREEMVKLVQKSEAQLIRRADSLERMYNESLESEKDEFSRQVTHLQAEFRKQCSAISDEKAELLRRTEEIRAACGRLEREKHEMEQKMRALSDECKMMGRDKEDLVTKTQHARAECERLGKEKAAMERKTNTLQSEFRAEVKRMAEEKGDLMLKTNVARSECEKLNAEKVQMFKHMTDFWESCERTMQSGKAEMAKKQQAMAKELEETRKEMAEQMTLEKAAAQRRMAAFREQTEAQLKTERQVTIDIMQCLRELPPLQTAMELGDVRLLDEELSKWNLEALPARFGECKGVVEAVVKLARERLLTWRGVQNDANEVLKESERTGGKGSVAALGEQCSRLFRAMKEAQLTKLDLTRSDSKITKKMCHVFNNWVQHGMSFPNTVHQSIVDKVVSSAQLGNFGFVDMDICLRLVDRSEDGNEIFLSRALAIVDDKTTSPKDMKSLLAHIETMLFFLKYAKSEDLRLTHQEFRKQISHVEPPVRMVLEQALSAYPPGSELARLSADLSLVDGKDVAAVLKEVRTTPRLAMDKLGCFREIFYQWAVAMRAKFDLLVLPHHTQVVCLMAFRHFLEEVSTPRGMSTPTALIAQVGTGEGKSMIIASLAIYVVVVLRKKVHIVVDDETLLERDFWTFKPLFDAFEIPETRKSPKRRIQAKFCVREERIATEQDACLAPRIDPMADVCYCEAKHVQSYYASIARGDNCDFDDYANCVLILDEVDALVIDQEPNEAFVYPNEELSEMATSVASALKRGRPVDQASNLASHEHPAYKRVCREMSSEWTAGMNMIAGQDFVYVKEVGKNCLLHNGRANTKEWSLALECRNFQDGHQRDILFQERLFVMSRPRVFRKYYRILGLTGSIGSDAERKFIQETYRAIFFEVPPFLKTCRGSPFHAAKPAPLGTRKQAVYVESDVETHSARIAEVAFEARDRVPVLVIAKDRSHAEHLVDTIRLMARSRGMGSASEDVVRSLSRTLYEHDPEQWKENLNRATLSLGDGNRQERGGKSWRITVTDPLGGRGVDYRVDDPDVDGRGGLLLIPTIVPTSQRDWVQFLGRTARQDRKGQFCAVLCQADYETLSRKYNKLLSGGNDLTAIDTVLSWGNRECTERIQGSAALYNCGVRMNEFCEEIFGKRSDLLRDLEVRERLVGICQSFRYMSVRDIDDAFGQIDINGVRTEAQDLGPALTAPSVINSPASSTRSDPKVVVFCLDWSASMSSQDTGTRLTRFETCIQCMQQLLSDQVRDCDIVGMVGFGADVRTVLFPTTKGPGQTRFREAIGQLKPSMAGGTCFFDAVDMCLQLMGLETVAPLHWPRWLVCLTDGDDLGSRHENAQGQLVTKALNSRTMTDLNMVIITVGALKEQNLRVIDSWVERVSNRGGLGRHVSEKDAAAIEMAFDVVAQILAADVGGAIEC